MSASQAPGSGSGGLVPVASLPALSAASTTGLKITLAKGFVALTSEISIAAALLLEEIFNHPHQRLGDAVLAAQRAYADSGAFA